MIYVKLTGRLGNNLFQIAAGATLAKRSGNEWVAFAAPDYYCPFPDNCYLPEYIQQFLSNIFRNVPLIQAEAVPQNIRQIGECDIRQVQVQPAEDVLLTGRYFFLFDWELVHTLFRIDDATETYIKTKYPFLCNQQRNYCAVVVRRGDYIWHRSEYTLCSEGYYKRAMHQMKRQLPDVQFYFISDDIEWCQRHFGKQANCMFVEDEEPIVDLYLTAKGCAILSNSTFALWGGYYKKMNQAA